MTHICVSKLTIIGSDNGLSADRHQAIIWTNAGILLIGPLGTNFSENLIEILAFKKMRLKVPSGKWRPICLGLSVLTRMHNMINKQRVLMHGHQGWNVRHGLCHIYMIYVYIWVVYSFCLFCCLFIIVTTQFVALYKPCKPKPKPPGLNPLPMTPPPPPPPPPPDNHPLAEIQRSILRPEPKQQICHQHANTDHFGK